MARKVRLGFYPTKNVHRIRESQRVAGEYVLERIKRGDCPSADEIEKGLIAETDTSVHYNADLTRVVAGRIRAFKERGLIKFDQRKRGWRLSSQDKTDDEQAQ